MMSRYCYKCKLNLRYHRQNAAELWEMYPKVLLEHKSRCYNLDLDLRHNVMPSPPITNSVTIAAPVRDHVAI